MKRVADLGPPFAPHHHQPGVRDNGAVMGDATNVIWQDPSGYDPFTHGPPYLPGMKVMSKTMSQKKASVSLPLAEGFELPSILAFLRALAVIHQGHHWLTFGNNYFGDHLLFERLYDETQAEIDQVAEKAIGVGCEASFIHPSWQMPLTNKIVDYFCETGVNTGGGASASSYVRISSLAEKTFVDFVGSAAKRMQARNGISRGVDNLLAGIEDKHQSHIYLLGQREKAESEPWSNP